MAKAHRIPDGLVLVFYALGGLLVLVSCSALLSFVGDTYLSDDRPPREKVEEACRVLFDWREAATASFDDPDAPYVGSLEGYDPYDQNPDDYELASGDELAGLVRSAGEDDPHWSALADDLQEITSQPGGDILDYIGEEQYQAQFAGPWRRAVDRALGRCSEVLGRSAPSVPWADNG